MSVADTMTNVAFIAVPVTMALGGLGGLVMLAFGRRGQRGGGQSGGKRHTRSVHRAQRNGTRKAY